MTTSAKYSGKKEYVHEKMAKAYAFFHVPSACEIDGWVYLTGVIATKEDGDQGDLEKGFTRAFEQITEVLLQAGCGWDDVVKITSFHIDCGTEIPVMAKVKDRYSQAPYPAWSVLGVASLANPLGVCEIEVIARKRG